MADQNNTNTVRPEFVTYNTCGLRPTGGIFTIDTETFQSEIKKVISKQINDVESVSYEVDYKTGVVRWYIWFNNNNDYFTDRSTSNSAIHAPIPRWSTDFQNFAKKFGYVEIEDDERGARDVKMKKIIVHNQYKQTGIQISVNSILIAMFDMNDQTFTKQFGSKPPKCKLSREYKFIKGSKGNFTNIAGIIVTKSMMNALDNRERPIARHSGNF